MESSQRPLKIWEFLPSSLLFFLAGGAGLYYTVFYTQPTLWPRWLFFFSVVLAVSGLVTPFIFALHKRFPSKPPVWPATILRESVLVGAFFAALIWMQIARVLTPSLGLILALAFIVIEFLLRIWERSTWRPK